MEKRRTGKNENPSNGLDGLCINTLRFLAIDAVEKANSGHPGMPMGDAPMAHVLWKSFLRHNPKNPLWPGRDRFVLSAGHGSMLLYSLLHLTGYAISLDDLKEFRQWGSKTPGHPEYHPETGVETTTGPLGQGFANGVGMAMAARYLAGRYNRDGFPLFDYHIYAITSDGDMMEGVSNEAASIAGHLGLGSLICLYSDNRITIEGETKLTFTEDVAARFEALGWHVEKVDGNDLSAIAAALEASRNETKRPSLIVARTNIGFGSPAKQDTSGVHGAPLGADEVKKTKENLGWPTEPDFYIPEEVLKEYRRAQKSGEEMEGEWNKLFEGYEKKHPGLAAELNEVLNGGLPSAWVEDVPEFTVDDGPIATRSASGKVLNAIAEKTPFLVGGSADLAPSTNTFLKGFGAFDRDNAGRNIHFGVREHAMGSILNGMALSRAVVPYGATFLIFSDYMRPPIRLAALMRLNVVYVFTHDSVGLGEDGPTHQPVEQLAGLRSIPGLTVIRPADANETAEAWKFTLKNSNGPTALVLTRQKLPVIDREKFSPAEGLQRGAYTLIDAEGCVPEIILMATGSEVGLALGAHEALLKRGVRARVVSMPSWEIFDSQDEGYKRSVLPPSVTLRVAVEAASPMGWRRYVGDEGVIIGVERFGASAPYKTIFEKFGLTVEAVTSRAVSLIDSKKDLVLDGL
ncbi:MAG: transketolase [Thermodesulfobacteriota bacterium]